MPDWTNGPAEGTGSSAVLLADQSMVLEHIARGAPVVDAVRGLDQLINRVFPNNRLLVSYEDRDLGFVCHAPGLPDDLVVGLAATKLVRADRRRTPVADRGRSFGSRPGTTSPKRPPAAGSPWPGCPT